MPLQIAPARLKDAELMVNTELAPQSSDEGQPALIESPLIELCQIWRLEVVNSSKAATSCSREFRNGLRSKYR